MTDTSMKTAIKNGKRRTILFDTGPEEHIWELNAKRLNADIASIECIQLSHWHRDHSGGMLKAASMISEAKRSGSATNKNQVIVDLHPDRPKFRGLMTPDGPVSMEANRAFDEIEAAGARVVKNDQAHVVLDGCFVVSGEIPRVTPYEVGIPNGIRLNETKRTWEADTLIKDERMLMCKVKGIVALIRHSFLLILFLQAKVL